MSTSARVFLIDGSSQMYRAYHAMRGARADRSGRQVHQRGLHLRHDAAQAAQRSPAASIIAASFDLPGRTFRDDLAADYKANRAPMPPDLAEQIPLVHEACEALGVPILTSRALRSRRRDRHAGRRRRPRPASRSRSSPATRTSSSWCTTASRSTTRATRAPGTTPAA